MLHLVKVDRASGDIHVPTLGEIYRLGFPRRGLSDEVLDFRKRNYKRLVGPMARMWAAQKLGITHMVSALYLMAIPKRGPERFLGLASMKVITDAGVQALVDAFQNSFEPENFKYHALGTGSTAEAAGQTALVSELTTQYNPDNTRATGSTTEGAGANVFRSVGTNTLDAAAVIEEHALMSQAPAGGGVMFDRSLTGTQTLGNGDGLQATYDLTFSSGG
jgi:hypothetical protein